MKVHKIEYKTGIKRSPEFERKGLAEYAVNCGVKCGHDCLYCSSKSLMRNHPAFKKLGYSPFGQGFSLVDPEISKLVEKDAARIKEAERGMVMMSTLSDMYAPEAQKYGLGRKVLGALMEQPGWLVRVLSKNCALQDDFDLIKAHRDRITLSLSTTTLRDEVSQIIEPNAPPTSKRLETLKKAKKEGLRVYGMLCPVMPFDIENTGYENLFKRVAALEPETMWIEPLNPRGNALTLMEASLMEKYPSEAHFINVIRTKEYWDGYAICLIEETQKFAQKYYDIGKVRMLMYQSSFSRDFDFSYISNQDGVIWL
jgi:DNA repair photolyase